MIALRKDFLDVVGIGGGVANLIGIDHQQGMEQGVRLGRERDLEGVGRDKDRGIERRIQNDLMGCGSWSLDDDVGDTGTVVGLAREKHGGEY